MARYFRRGGEFLVNTVTDGNQLDPVIAPLASGGFVVMWANPDGQGGDIKAQLYDAAANRVGGEFFVNSTTAGEQFLHSVAPLSTGGFVACWMDLAARHSVVGQLFDAAGTKVGTEFVVDSTVAYDQFAPTIAALASGGFAIAWEGYGSQGDGNGGAIRAQLFDAAGVKVGGEILVNDPGPNDQFAPALVALSGGGFVATWIDPVSRLIRAKVFDVFGGQLGAEFVVGGAVALVEQPPSLVALASGGFVIAWQDTSNTVQAQRFLADGTAAGAAIPVASGFGPALAALPGGGFIVSWADNDVKAQVFDAAGNEVGGEFIVNSTLANSQRLAALAPLAEGGLAAVWIDLSGEGGDASGASIKGQILFIGVEGTSGDDTLTGTSAIDYLVLDHGGNDTVQSGDGDDLIYFGGAFDIGDTIVGTATDYDRLVLHGDYSAGVVIDNSRVTGVYTIELVSGYDHTYGQPGNTPFNYDIEIGGSNGVPLTIDGSTLLSNEQMFIDGSDEAATPFVIVGGQGSDGLAGGAQADTIHGGRGNDSLAGNGGNDTLYGEDGDDFVFGGHGNDLLYLTSGNDTADGGPDNDGLFFGASFGVLDRADGGAGSDQLGLQGDYSAGLTFGETQVAGIETLVLLPGSDTRFGDTANNFYSYRIATADGNVAAGSLFVVTWNTLRAGENVIFDGRSETDGSILTYGGLGADAVTGGQQADGFYFGVGRWGAADQLDGQGGSDQLGLQGDYSGANGIAFSAGQLTGVEVIVLLSGADTRFGGGGVSFGYDLTMHDGNVAAGATLAISANTLRAGEALNFNGAAETNGAFRVFSGAGNDTIAGGAGNDQIFGGAGADSLTGGAGNDVFAYISAGHSTQAASDTITDFAPGDRIDLSGIDANANTVQNDSFTFIGANAFQGVAGELRAEDQGNGTWLVMGDTDGDRNADLWIEVHATPATPITSADFVF